MFVPIEVVVVTGIVEVVDGAVVVETFELASLHADNAKTVIATTGANIGCLYFMQIRQPSQRCCGA